MQVIHLIHGLHTFDPAQNIGRWMPYLEDAGFAVRVHRYGYLPFGLAWMRNPGIARRIANTVRADDILICHSNGAAIAYLIGEMRRFRGVVLVNGALDRDKVIPGVDWQMNYYTPGDDVLKYARIPFHLWGRIGTKGYSGHDSRNQDFNMAELLPACRGHSDPFRKDYSPPWALRVAQQIYLMLGVTRS